MRGYDCVGKCGWTIKMCESNECKRDNAMNVHVHSCVLDIESDKYFRIKSD